MDRSAEVAEVAQQIHIATQNGGGWGHELVAQNLRASIDSSENHARLHWWRTRGGSEVDFVVYGPGVFEAIEVKHTTTVRPADLRGLRAFADDYPEARRVLLHRGTERSVRDGVEVMPCDAYLRAIVPGRPLPPSP